MVNKPLNLEPNTGPELDFWEHLAELRRRLIVCALAIVITSTAAYSFATNLFTILQTPFVVAFPGHSLIGTGPAEAFILKLKIAVFMGFIGSSPILFSQFWLFIRPGLYEQERRWVAPFVFTATILFGLGLSFCYWIVLPFAFEFFREQYYSIGIAPTIRISEHLALMMRALLGFGIVFEMPLVAFVCGRAGLLSSKTLMNWWRYATVVIFVIAAILTPPDVLTQILMAGPLLLLYGISILIVKHTGRLR